MRFEHLPEWLPYAESVVASVVTVLLALVVYIFLNRVLKSAVAKGALTAPVVGIFRLVIRLVLTGLVVLLVLQEFGVLQNVWAAIVAVLAMIAIGFVAVWSIMSNILCTLLIIIYRMFLVGDRVTIPADDLAGTVIDINLMYTSLRGKDGQLIQVPNSLFFQKPIERRPGSESVDLWDQLMSNEPCERSKVTQSVQPLSDT